MSTITVTKQTESQLRVERNTEKLFLGGNRYEKSMTFLGAEDTTTPAGTLLEYDVANDQVLAFDNASGNAPFGILAKDVVLDVGVTTATTSVCVAGDVNENLIVEPAAEDVKYFKGGHFAFRIIPFNSNMQF